MYATILWATDGSPEADGALREALDLLEPGGTLVAFHSNQRFVGGHIGGEPVALDEKERQEHIAAQIRELRHDGVSVKHLVESTHHDPSHEITAAAAELDVDAIVCGTTAPHGLHALNGSVAARILKRATVPVIVVPAKSLVAHPDATAV